MAKFSIPKVRKPAAVPEHVASIAAREMSRLWQAHGIIELAVAAIADEPDNGPGVKQPLRAAAEIILRSINALEPICIPVGAEVAHHG